MVCTIHLKYYEILQTNFLFDFYGHHLSISYRSRDHAAQNFEGPTNISDFHLLKVKVKNRFF